MGYTKKPERYSYSKLNTFISCPFRYYLNYIKGYYIDTPNLNNLFGTLVHKIEERIGICLKNHEKIDYEALKNDFLNYNIPKTSKYDMGGDIYGINVLKKMFPEDYYKVDVNGKSFATEAEDYLNFGIYRLEEYMNDHPNLSIYGTEIHFEIGFNDVVLTGSIDRVLFDSDTNEYIIEDIKSKSKPFKDDDLVTPLQAVMYSIALKSIANLDDYPTRFRYDLPVLSMRQEGGTKGYIQRGIKKINHTLDAIHAMEIEAKGSPLCYWCPYSATNPAQKEEAKGLCPYYALWRPGDRMSSNMCHHKWEGLDKHDQIVKDELDRTQKIKDEEFDF